MINQKLKEKIDYYEQFYFTLDDPIPFIGDLKIHPVTVRDYYKFYSLISCFTIDKNKTPEGISMSNLAFLIKMMENEEVGGNITAQVIALFELIFKVPNGLYCSNKECNDKNDMEFIPYDEVRKQLANLPKKEDKEKYFNKIRFCPHCGKPMREVYSIKASQDNPLKTLTVYDTEIISKKFDELRSIVCYQNMPDFSDEYIDPDLKRDLDSKAEMQRQEYSQPSLEKQLICISISTPYTVEMLKDITIRKMVLLLRNVDAKAHYFCYKSGEMSGMVKFSSPPRHWIYANNKNDLSKEIMTLEEVNKKFELVT